MVSGQQVLADLSKIIDPDFQRDIVSMGFVRGMKIEGATVSFTIELTTPACPLSPVFQRQAIGPMATTPAFSHIKPFAD